MKYGSSWKVQSPCLGCADRFVGCHSKCDRFTAYQQELSEFKNEMIKRKTAEETVDEYVTKAQIKNSRKKKYER